MDTGPHNYAGVNLNNQLLLAQDGWAPSEGNPQFHQQMVYAVAMKTIEHFERALGRPILWRPRPNPTNPNDDSNFVQQLTIRPHALQKANAYYSPQEVALLFGYFEAPGDPGYPAAGSPVYTCCRTTSSPTRRPTPSSTACTDASTNRPTSTFWRSTRRSPTSSPCCSTSPSPSSSSEIARRGATSKPTPCWASWRSSSDAPLRAAGLCATRSARSRTASGSASAPIRTTSPNGSRRTPAVPCWWRPSSTPLIAIYKRRIADLLRIYTGGTGVLPSGAIHPDLVGRLAAEAAKSANHVLDMCIRALDYLPPVDVTFFDYLRALITADFEIVTDDRHNYRVAFVEAFSRRAIFPGDHDEGSTDGGRALSADTLRWPGFSEYKIDSRARTTVMEHYHAIVEQLKRYADACIYLTDRQKLFDETRQRRIDLHDALEKAFAADHAFAESLGLDPNSKFEVHTLRRAMRLRLDGRAAPQVFVSLIQKHKVESDPATGVPDHTFLGGSTLVVDLTDAELPKYRILKRVKSRVRRAATARFLAEVEADPLRRLFFSVDRKEPFAALHELADEGT